MKTLTLSTFDPEQQDISKVICEVENTKEDVLINLSDNSGGQISKAKQLINILRMHNYKIKIEVTGVIASAAAFFWSYLLFAKEAGYFRNVELSLPDGKLALIYHRPRKIIDGDVVFIEELTDEEDIKILSVEVNESDLHFVRIMQRFPESIMYPYEGTIRYYSKEEIFTLYQNNKDIVILLGDINGPNLQ